jgi:hypothetical protein
MRILIIVLSQMLICTPVFAADNRGKVEELLIQMQIPKSVENTRARMKELYVQQARSIKVSEENKDIVETFINGMSEVITNEFEWERVKENYIDTFSTTFSEQEIEQLLQFYKSDVGKMYAGKLQTLTEKQMKVGERIAQTIQPKILGLQNEMVKEAQRRAAIKMLKERDEKQQQGKAQ